MAETPESITGLAVSALSKASAQDELKAWFVSEVLPLEPVLMQFLRHSWRQATDIPDLRQDIYIRVLEAARRQIPNPVKPFVFATARNLLIDRFRRQRIIPFDGVPNLEEIDIASDAPLPDRSVIARDELRRLQAALEVLPPRNREAIMLRQIEGLSRREIALRMGISELTVRWHLNEGAKLLINILQEHRAGSGDLP